MPDKKVRKGERLRFFVHPLFLLFGAYFAATGKLFLFLNCTVVALLHECGHAFAAAKIGYRLNRIVLMPYGALVKGDIDGVSLKDEIFIALAGPLVNAACAVLFVALWWCFPDTYPYTDVAAYSSAAIALVNLIPAWPLDGGRILYCAIAKAKGEKLAGRIARGAGLFFGIVLFAMFVYGCFVQVNFTMLFFSLFLLAGAVGGKNCSYDRIRYDYAKEMRRGMEIKRVAVVKDCKIKRLLSFMERGKYLEITVYDEDGRFFGEITQGELVKILETAELYAPVGEFVQEY